MIVVVVVASGFVSWICVAFELCIICISVEFRWFGKFAAYVRWANNDMRDSLRPASSLFLPVDLTVVFYSSTWPYKWTFTQQYTTMAGLASTCHAEYSPWWQVQYRCFGGHSLCTAMTTCSLFTSSLHRVITSLGHAICLQLPLEYKYAVHLWAIFLPLHRRPTASSTSYRFFNILQLYQHVIAAPTSYRILHHTKHGGCNNRSVLVSTPQRLSSMNAC